MSNPTSNYGSRMDGRAASDMNPFDDILDLPHFHLAGKPFMTNRERAAQFAPYKSLVGYEELIERQAEEILNTSEREIIFDDSDRGLDWSPEDDGDDVKYAEI